MIGKNNFKSISLVTASVVLIVVFLNLSLPLGNSKGENDTAFCITHQIAEQDCPWCDPGIIKTRGECREHGVPEALCVQCNSSLIAGFKTENDWCGGHSVPESQCTLCGGQCGPSTSDTPPSCAHGIPGDTCPFCDQSLIESMGFCSGHGVAEVLCTQCNPGVIPAFKAVDDWCAGHDIPESQCFLCNPEILDPDNADALDTTAQQGITGDQPRHLRFPVVTCRKHTLKIQFESPDTARNAGLEYSHATQQALTRKIRCNAEIEYHGSWYAKIGSRAPGIVTEIRKDLGQTVAADELLATVDSADLGTVSAEYLQAKTRVNLWDTNHTREQTLQKRGVSSEQEVLEAETKLTEARIALASTFRKLQNLGLTREQIRLVNDMNDISSLLPVKAPFDGIVIQRAASVGECVDPQSPIFTIADTSRMWALLDVYESDVQNLRLGQTVIFRSEGLPGEPQVGQITWISSQLDRRTRTLKVRAELDNPDRLLRAGMFGTSEISIDRDIALLIPREAVQWEGCCNVVFVRKSDTLFEPRKVRIGYETDGFYVVEEGLAPQEQIVTTGSFLLKTEILKGSIGAGCCEVDPGKEV